MSSEKGIVPCSPQGHRCSSSRSTDDHPTPCCEPVTSYDDDKALHPTFALSHSNVPELLQTQDSPIGREGVWLSGRKSAYEYATGY
jgi:hypothetical protein